MHYSDRKPYVKPEFVEYGRIEEITSTKSWHAANDWLGELIDVFVPGDNTNILGNTSQFS